MTAIAVRDDLSMDVLTEAGVWGEVLSNADEVCRTAAVAAWTMAGPPGIQAEVCVLLTDDGTVRRLNRTYRGHDQATDVLAFASMSPGAPPGTDGSAHPIGLGDVVIACETTCADANAAGRPLRHHLSHLVIHGMLHLLGYDHGNDHDAARMEGLEIGILAGLGIPDPYGPDDTVEQ